MDSIDMFWIAALHWWRNKPKIVLDFFGQNPPIADTFTATVVTINGDTITFKNESTGEDKPVNFLGTEMRLASYDPEDSTSAFVALWEDGLESVKCVMTEKR